MVQSETFFESNLRLLEKYHPDVYTRIKDPELKPVGKLIQLPNGAKNLEIRDKNNKSRLIHGPNGPKDDTAQFLEMLPAEASGVTVMIGFGLGIPCLEILKQRQHLRHLFIFDFNPGLFKQALFANDLSELLSDNRVKFCFDKSPNFNKVFINAFKALELEDIQILKHKTSISLDTEYNSLRDDLFTYLNAFSIRGATTKVRGKLFVRNRLKNLKRIRNDILVDSMKGIFDGIPAILIAGGPSLDKNIDQLKKARGKALLFAVDTVVPTLLKKGIIPNFISAIDPQKITLEKFKGAQMPDRGMSLICSSWVAPEVPYRLPVERVIWTFGGRNIEVLINKALGGSKTYIGAGTVAHLNLHAALDMGCRPVTFVGQDLAFSEKKDHAQNVSLNSNERMETILGSKSDWLWVKSIHGDQIKTSRSFYNHKIVFEDIIKNNPDIEFFNATEGGAHIEGSRVNSLEAALETFPDIGFNANDIIYKNADVTGDKKTSALDQQLKELVQTGDQILSQINSFRLLAKELKKQIRTLKKKPKPINDFSRLPLKTQQKIKKLDQQTARLDKHNLIWMILDEVTFEGLKKSEKMLHEINRIAKDKTRYLEWLQKNIERVDLINEVRTDLISWFNQDLSDVIDFHERERSFFENANKPDNQEQIYESLGRFYFENGITALALKQLDKIAKTDQDAGLQFIKGCAFAVCGDMRAAEKCFEKSLLLDPEMENRINGFKQEQADAYLDFGTEWKIKDLGTSRRLFVKGLKFKKDHEGIKKSLNLLLKKELDKIPEALTRNKFAKTRKKIVPWLKDIESESLLENILEPKPLASLFCFAGNMSVQKKEFETAYNQYLKAAHYTPDDPSVYIYITDLCFSVSDFEKGVIALNTAVQLDPSNAKYWEIIGDTFVENGSLEDALSAYEKCYMEMPDRIHLLKKIGDVYQAAGNPEAAHQAYMEYKKKITPS